MSGTDDACITCGDVAVALEVVSVHGTDATCRAPDGGEELVAIDLVLDVHPGDHLLVHARVALEKLDDVSTGPDPSERTSVGSPSPRGDRPGPVARHDGGGELGRRAERAERARTGA